MSDFEVHSNPENPADFEVEQKGGNPYPALATRTKSGYVLHLDSLATLSRKVRTADANGDSLQLDPDEVRMLASTLRLLARSGKPQG